MSADPFADLRSGPPDAPPVVFLHGWGACKEMWALTFRSTLANSFQLIAVDLPGTGASELGEIKTTSDTADWLADTMDTLGIQRFALVGHSMGANVACHFAAKYPGRVDKMVIISGALFSDRLSHANWYLNPQIGHVVLGGARAIAGAAGWVESKMPSTKSLGWGRGYARRSGYLMFNNKLPALQIQLAGMLKSPADILSLAPDLPILIIHGGKDTTIPSEWAYEAAAMRSANLRLVIYPDALHCPMDTHGGEFVDDLGDFLSSVP